jgi:hypothetical protein
MLVQDFDEYLTEQHSARRASLFHTIGNSLGPALRKEPAELFPLAGLERAKRGPDH